MLCAGVLEGMQVTAPGWTARFFPETAKTPAIWAAAPNADLTLAPGESVVFTLNQIACPPKTVAGNFQIYTFALPEFPDTVVPLLLPVGVQP